MTAASLLTGLLGILPLWQLYMVSGQGFSLFTGFFFLSTAWFISAKGTARKTAPSRIIAVGILFPWIVKGAVLTLSWPFTSQGSYFYILFDADFSLLIFLYYLFFFFSFLSHTRPDKAPLLLSFLILISGGLLYSQKSLSLKISLFLTLGGTFFFLVLGIFYLVACHKRSLSSPRSGLQKRLGLGLLLLLFLIGLFFLLRSYEEKSLSEGGGLLQNDLFSFDFSEVLELQSEISLSDELVMLFRKEGKAERLLIRRYVLDHYDREQGFYREGDSSEVPPGGVCYEDPQYKNRSQVIQEYYLINMNPTASLGLNYPVEIVPYGKWEGASFQRVLRTVSWVNSSHWWDLLDVKEFQMSEEEHLLYTDYGDREKVAGLARNVTDSIHSPVEKVMAVKNYLKDNYYYSLNPGGSSVEDRLNYFLFVSKKGYCSYFAYAMTLMLRSLDIPSRVVVGFWVSPDSEVLNFYPVAANQAHAWVEVYFNDWGWIEFDPTSQTFAEGESYSFGGVDYEQYGKLIEEIIHHENDLVPETAGAGGGTMEKSLKKAVKTLGLFKGEFLLLGFICYMIWTILSRYIPLAGRNTSPGKKVVFSYVGVRKELFRMAYPGRLEETPLDYAHRLERESPLQLQGLTELYLKSEFSSLFTEEDRLSFQKSLGDYKLSRKKLSLWRRLLALFYPIPQIRRYL
jgi:transglutaminase-like putative cysteine protease